MKFAKVHADQQNKLKIGDLFAKGLPYYMTRHTEIIQELDLDITRTTQALINQQAEKEAAFSQVLELFDKLTTYYAPSEAKAQVKANEAVEVAIQSIRNLPLSGFVNGKPHDFLWPTKEDLLKMPTNQPIRAVKLRWKAKEGHTPFTGVQVVLSNGIESPLFLG